MKTSAGLLPFRTHPRLEVLIAHPGGPHWARRDEGAWSVVKGEVDAGEEPERAARREFSEETGWDLPQADLIPLGEVTQRAGKRVLAWAMECDLDPETLRPGTFQMQWRGRLAEFPEIDRVAWCTPEEAARLLNPAQVPFLDRLLDVVGGAGG